MRPRWLQSRELDVLELEEQINSQVQQEVDRSQREAEGTVGRRDPLRPGRPLDGGEQLRSVRVSATRLGL